MKNNKKLLLNKKFLWPLALASAAWLIWLGLGFYQDYNALKATIPNLEKEFAIEIVDFKYEGEEDGVHDMEIRIKDFLPLEDTKTERLEELADSINLFLRNTPELENARKKIIFDDGVGGIQRSFSYE